MAFKTQKIRVASPAISAAIQEDLFKQGYKWSSVGKNAQHTAAHFLYANDEGRLSYGTDADNFASKSYPEFIYTTESKLVVVDKNMARPKVVLFGKTYFKDELEAALGSLSEARP